MAAPRLPFLWPFLFKAARPIPPRSLPRSSRRTLKSSARRGQEVSTQRYGTANEPLPHVRPESAPSKGAQGKNASKSSTKAKADTAKAETAKPQKQSKGETASKDTPQEEMPLLMSPNPEAAAAPSVLAMPPPSSSSAASSTEPKPIEKQSSSSTSTPKSAGEKAAESLPGLDDAPIAIPPPPPKILAGGALEAVLNMPSSSTLAAAQSPASSQYYHENASGGPDEHRPPHINTPRYVHHFDTYSLVKRLNEGNWSDEQAVTVMKAVRLILADNMDLARDGLVSKSDVENETYLFRAACSELRTEVGTRRKAEVEKTRSERSGLQHEADIIGQRVGMEAAGLREELKGMVEGRKMAVREEGRSVDSKIQELNYRITVALNSDLRSDVEGVRWIITKRAITALSICVLMVIAALKYASSAMQHEEDTRKKRKAAEKAAAAAATSANNSESGSGGSALSDHHSHLPPGTELAVGDNPGYISLG